MPITIPFIHSTGTGPQCLLDDNLNARNAIEDALRVIQKMEFNARDYYPVEGSWDKAKAERLTHIESLRNASQYFLAIAEHCSDVISQREGEIASRHLADYSRNNG